jgi:nitrogen fixation NifU-like protein
MYMTLRCVGECIVKASFETYGCPTAFRCGHWVTEWVAGRSPAFVTVLTPQDLIQVVGGVPLGKEHCADLVVNALRDAVKGWEESRALAPPTTTT